MNQAEGVVLLIIAITTIVSYQGFRSFSFFNKYKFEVDPILIEKDYVRLISAGFLHANWRHLLFNMVALYSFGSSVGYMLGMQNTLILYFVSLIAGNLMALYIHREHGDYAGIGASGAVSGVVFSSILMFPGADISFILVPVSIPAWLFGIAYLLLSIYGVKTQMGNIGHEAHLGGAIAGILTSLYLEPAILEQSPLLLAALLIPFALFMYLIVKNPAVLLIEGYWGLESTALPEEESDDESVLNNLLDKVSRNGIQSLSKREREQLEELSRKLEQ
jgi:membrane associated rhomboid family serine protease